MRLEVEFWHTDSFSIPKNVAMSIAYFPNFIYDNFGNDFVLLTVRDQGVHSVEDRLEYS